MQSHDEGESWKNPAATPQPPPLAGQTDITPLVIADLEARREMGIAKYGVPLTVENGRDHAMDMWQEMLDMVVYAKCMLVKRAQLKIRMRSVIDQMYRYADVDIEAMAEELAKIHLEL